MDLSFANLNDFFAVALQDLHCGENTKSYLINLYASYQKSTYDLSQENITLVFLEGRSTGDFHLLQQCADWIFFAQSMMPGHLSSADYYRDIGRLSYYTCYKLINRKWALFEELSDRFIALEEEASAKLNMIQIK